MPAIFLPLDAIHGGTPPGNPEACTSRFSGPLAGVDQVCDHDHAGDTHEGEYDPG